MIFNFEAKLTNTFTLCENSRFWSHFFNKDNNDLKSNMLDCEICHTNQMTPHLTRCCKLFICSTCKDKLDTKTACNCGRTIQVAKKSTTQCPEIYDIIKKYREGHRRECDRCQNKAELQCVNCDMHFCRNCNSQVHAAIGFIKHERVKISKVITPQKMKRRQAFCSIHSQSIMVGCECGVGLCSTCLKNHKELCPKGFKPKTLKQFKEEYFLNLLFKMRQIQQYKQRLQKDQQKYAEHYQSQQSLFLQQKGHICQQFQYLIKLVQMKYSQTKTRLTNYWKQSQKVYTANVLKMTQQIVKYDQYAEILSDFTNHLLNLDYFDRKIIRTNVNFQFINLKTFGIDQVQSSILNVNLVEKIWQKGQTQNILSQAQENKPNFKQQSRFISNIQSISDQIIEYTNNPLKDRVFSLTPSHCEVHYTFIHLPYQHLKYELQYGVGMKMKGQQIFKRIQNNNGYGTIQGLNPNTKYRIRMRVCDGQWGQISQVITLDIPRFNLENSLCAKSTADNSIQLVKGGAVYGSNQINFGIHRWVIKMTSKSISYEQNETACMSVGVSNKQSKKAVFVGTTLNYGYQKSEIIVKVLLDCYQKRLVILNSTTNKQDVYQNLPNFPLFPTIQNKGNGQILVKYNLSTDEPNLC